MDFEHPVPSELTHGGADAEPPAKPKMIVQQPVAFEEVPAMLLMNVDSLSVSSIRAFLELMPRDFELSKLETHRSMQAMQKAQSYQSGESMRTKLLQQLPLDGPAILNQIPPEQLQEYLSNAPPSDQILTEFIKRALLNLDPKQIEMQFHMEIKEQLERVYDVPNPLIQKIKAKEQQQQQKTSFNFKDFITKKLMNQIGSKNSPKLGRLIFSQIGDSLIDFHKPKTQNEFAAFHVSCFDTSNPILEPLEQQMETDDDSSFNTRNLYCCSGRTVVFEHAEPFPLGSSLPGMGYQLQLKTALSETVLRQFERDFCGEQERQPAEMDADTDDGVSAHSAHSAATYFTAGRQIGDGAFGTAGAAKRQHPESLFPQIHQQNQKFHVLFDKDKTEYDKIYKMFFSGPMAEHVQPILEGCQGIMQFWSYRQRNRFLLVRDRRGSVKNTASYSIQAGMRQYPIFKSNWQLRKLPMAFFCGQLIPRAEFCIKNQSAKASDTSQNKNQRTSLIDFNTYLFQRQNALTQASFGDEQMKLIKKIWSPRQPNKPSETKPAAAAPGRGKDDKDYGICLKILAYENQTATSLYIKNFMAHCNPYEHLRRIFALKEERQSPEQMFPGMLLIDRFICWQQTIYALMTDRRLVRWNDIKTKDMHSGKSWNLVDKRAYDAFGNEGQCLMFQTDYLFNLAQRLTQNSVFIEKSRDRSFLSMFDAKSIVADPYQRNQFILMNTIFDGGDDIHGLIWMKAFAGDTQERNAYVLKPDIERSCKELMQKIQYDRQLIQEVRHFYVENEDAKKALMTIGVKFQDRGDGNEKTEGLVEHKDLFPNLSTGNGQVLAGKKISDAGRLIYFHSETDQGRAEDKERRLKAFKEDDELYKSYLRFAYFSKKDDPTKRSPLMNDLVFCLYNQFQLLRGQDDRVQHFFSTSQCKSFSYKQCCFGAMQTNMVDQDYTKIDLIALVKQIREKIERQDKDISSELKKIETAWEPRQIWQDNELDAIIDTFQMMGKNFHAKHKNEVSYHFTHGDASSSGSTIFTNIVQQLATISAYEKKAKDFAELYEKLSETQQLCKYPPRLVASCRYVLSPNPGNYNQFKLMQRGASTVIQHVAPGLQNAALASSPDGFYVIQSSEYQLEHRVLRLEPVQDDNEFILNPLIELTQIDANVFRTHLRKQTDLMFSTEAAEQLYGTFQEVLGQDLNAFMVEKQTEVKRYREQYKHEQLRFLPELRQIYSKRPKKEGVFMIRDFIQYVYTDVVIVLIATMIPYSILPKEYFASEQTLFVDLYDPNKVIGQTDADKKYGMATYFGCCYQLLLNLRGWFSKNYELLETIVCSLVKKEFSKLQIVNLQPGDHDQDIRFAAITAVSNGWMKLFHETINADIVLVVKRYQETSLPATGVPFVWNPEWDFVDADAEAKPQ